MAFSTRAGLLSTTLIVLQFLANPAAAQTAPTPVAPVAPAGPLEVASDVNDTSDIIVTAQKRDQRLQDVPVPVTLVSAETLTQSGKVSVKDFFTAIPGLSINGGTYGTSISIRGLTTSGGNPTVGTVIDEVPFGSSTNLGGGGPVPEFDPSDLSAIEVLRGPQGTLYGANSLGGLLKYDSVDPSTAGVSGRFEVAGTSVSKGEFGYTVRGGLNVPLNDTIAVHVSGFSRRDPGFIDNVQTGKDNVNRTDAYGGRFSLLWRPSTSFSLKLNALYQRDKQLGYPFADTDQPDLQQSRLINTGETVRKTQVYSATARGQLGIVELTSITGYSVYDSQGYRDFTYAFGPPTQANFGVGGDRLANPALTKKFSQEVRVALPIGDKIDWLMGGFYTHEKSVLGTDLQAIDQVTGRVAAQILDQPITTTYDEYAAFGNLTYKFTDKFNIQFGGRVSKIKQHYETIYQGPYNTIFLGRPDPFTPPEQNTTDNTFTFLVTPQYKFSKDLMVYARVASGYRPGGPNSNNSTSLLPSYGPDKTQNYEIGMKGDLLDHHLTFDASVYYIEWKDIQLAVTDPVTRAQIFVNGSNAKSQGVELSVTGRPTGGLTISGWVAYNDAVLTEDLPAASTAAGRDGDRLPNSSRFSGTISVDQQFNLSGNVTANFGANLNYVGKRVGQFEGLGTPRLEFPEYAQFDLHAGLKTGPWSANLYLNNATDKRGVLPSAGGAPNAILYIQPRTVGLSLVRTF